MGGQHSQEMTPVQLAQRIVTGGREITRILHLIDTPEGAKEIGYLAREVVTAAQEILGVAGHVDTPAEPLSGTWAESDREDYAVNPNGGQQ